MDSYPQMIPIQNAINNPSLKLYNLITGRSSPICVENDIFDQYVGNRPPKNQIFGFKTICSGVNKTLYLHPPRLMQMNNSGVWEPLRFKGFSNTFLFNISNNMKGYTKDVNAKVDSIHVYDSNNLVDKSGNMSELNKLACLSERIMFAAYYLFLMKIYKVDVNEFNSWLPQNVSYTDPPDTALLLQKLVDKALSIAKGSNGQSRPRVTKFTKAVESELKEHPNMCQLIANALETNQLSTLKVTYNNNFYRRQLIISESGDYIQSMLLYNLHQLGLAIRFDGMRSPPQTNDPIDATLFNVYQFSQQNAMYKVGVQNNYSISETKAMQHMSTAEEESDMNSYIKHFKATDGVGNVSGEFKVITEENSVVSYANNTKQFTKTPTRVLINNSTPSAVKLTKKMVIENLNGGFSGGFSIYPEIAWSYSSKSSPTLNLLAQYLRINSASSGVGNFMDRDIDELDKEFDKIQARQTVQYEVTQDMDDNLPPLDDISGGTTFNDGEM